ncbi:MAG: extracellular matrix/biofilm biosynthesis regulator RemA family protein [Ethanoligenens sp.]|uniref:extracellular matrix regulator RemB n=1 Tax=Ethanoligenens sp. TaxID=2099655 RepID=UPI0039EA075C
MYLHIGQDTVVRLQDIVGIFDIDTTSVSAITRDYLKNAQQSGMIINVTDELPKSFVVCHEKKRIESDERVKVYISQISSTTLLKRSMVNGFSDGI